jgi:hypothetical protein
MLAGPHPRSLPFDLAQGSPEVLEGLRLDSLRFRLR